MNRGNSESDDQIESLRAALRAECERSRELEKRLRRAEGEIERFVSIAAHNLRESLRDVASFSQLFAEHRAEHLDADAHLFLERIKNGAAKMDSLLTAIVEYWAVGTGTGPPARTEMEAVLRQVVLSMDQQASRHGATVTHDALPAVIGDFETLVKVLQHLINNAITYCGTGSPAIHVSSELHDSECVLSVRDNGPGIDPAFHKRIFEPFTRLHGKEYPGNGLGLALCRKSVEHLGGRMWVSSCPGSGSTFYFSLPIAE
jgi:light-regulated signal transduction histidine kinase (bacteriophytochrome)